MVSIKNIEVYVFVKTFIIVGIILSLFIMLVIEKNFSLSFVTSTDDIAQVTRVIDGDTIKIKGGETVRYIGIDAPETVDPRKPVECFGKEAYLKNKELVEGKMVRLERDISNRDTYQRLLRYVWIGKTLVNAELVKQGFTYAYSFPPNIKYQNIFIKSQQEALQKSRGLWRLCEY